MSLQYSSTDSIVVLVLLVLASTTSTGIISIIIVRMVVLVAFGFLFSLGMALYSVDGIVQNLSILKKIEYLSHRLFHIVQPLAGYCV